MINFKNVLAKTLLHSESEHIIWTCLQNDMVSNMRDKMHYHISFELTVRKTGETSRKQNRQNNVQNMSTISECTENCKLDIVESLQDSGHLSVIDR